MRTITPTRHNLHALDGRIELAERGHRVPERKRDGLVLEFLDVLDRYETVRRDLDDRYEHAQHGLDLVRALEGGMALEGIARARAEHPTVVVSWHAVLGVSLPQFEPSSVRTDLAHHGYGLLGSSPVLDGLVDAYEGLVEQVVAFAELETAAFLLIESIERTQRRVKALEVAILPELRATRDRIRRRLDEREQEERIRQKWFKDKKERRRIHEEPPGGRVRSPRRDRIRESPRRADEGEETLEEGAVEEADAGAAAEPFQDEVDVENTTNTDDA